MEKAAAYKLIWGRQNPHNKTMRRQQLYKPELIQNRRVRGKKRGAVECIVFAQHAVVLAPFRTLICIHLQWKWIGLVCAAFIVNLPVYALFCWAGCVVLCQNTVRLTQRRQFITNFSVRFGRSFRYINVGIVLEGGGWLVGLVGGGGTQREGTSITPIRVIPRTLRRLHCGCWVQLFARSRATWPYIYIYISDKWQFCGGKWCDENESGRR